MYVSAPQISAEKAKRFTDYILARQLVLLKERERKTCLVEAVLIKSSLLVNFFTESNHFK